LRKAYLKNKLIIGPAVISVIGKIVENTGNIIKDNKKENIKLRINVLL
jgi:hypothetical protein